MNLDETQKATVREWIETGLEISAIQSKLDSEFGVSMTYMEVRFLVDDLGVTPKDPEPEKTPAGTDRAGTPIIPDEPAGPREPDSDGDDSVGAPSVGEGVSVTVDQITRAGALASGRVTFSDGKGAGWTLDQLGRLGLSADEAGYKPPQEDVMAFQVALQKKLSGSRF